MLITFRYLFLSLLRINNLNPRHAKRAGTPFRPPPGAREGRKVKVQRSAETEEHATKVNAGNRKWEVLLPLPKNRTVKDCPVFYPIRRIGM